MNVDIDIAIPSNEAYFPGLLVTICSIVKYADMASRLRFHVLDGGIPTASFRKLSDSVARINPDAQIDRICINELSLSSLPDWRGNKMTYARILLPSLLPDLDYVLYVDSDMLWLTDISEVWKYRDDSLIKGVRDQYTCEGDLDDEVAFYRKHGFEFDQGKLINGGLLLYNLKRMRQENASEKVFEFLKTYSDVPFADQSAYSCVFRDKICLLPDKYNTLSRELRPGMIRDGVVIHYAGCFQPWRASGIRWMLADNMLIWHCVNAAIENVTVWKSYCMYYCKWSYFYRRLMFLLFAGRITRPLMRFIFCHTGKGNRSWLRRYYLVHGVRFLEEFHVAHDQQWR